ncbi:hypothetical protein Zmor_008117 [Zophobas morio]|uniref:Uncharacterized protein n=1 Tax=Zophobas morio TaxID=2755281 RepID=A0AA38J3N9_9CUCU|nr:hypothetical protein Zmor_008117 [Zophobas morio]
MAPTLYMIPPSPPVRSVLMTAKALGLTLNEKIINFPAGEHLQPEYLKLNPQHTVPTLVDDDGFAVWDSNAINPYLIGKYAKDDSLYPQDLQKRAIVDQRLHFNGSVAFGAVAGIVRCILYEGKTCLDDNDKTRVEQVYAFLEAFLDDGKPWMAGDCLTVADYNLYATVSAGDVLVPIDGQKYPKVATWFEKVGNLPEAEATKKGLAIFESLISSKLQ